MNSRRQFLNRLAAAGGGLSLLSFADPVFAAEAEDIMKKMSAREEAGDVEDEEFWGWVRSSFTVSPNIINLNNGGVAPQPKVVQDAHIRFYQYCNEAPSYYMWQILDQGREPLREKLAGLCGCSAEEVAINRNATEGLNSIIFGLNLKAGDEVILTKQDYPNMMNAWKQREKRDGIKLVWLNLPLPLENEADIAKYYINAFTPKTKVVHVTHLINWVGQITPVKMIAQAAHQRGIEVIADGAHTLGHFEFKVPDLECDYFASSLHKWLSAPFGSGLLYIKKDKIKNIWALLSNNEPDGPDIRKFESLGTRSFASEMAIGTAVDFHDIIGGARKERRLRYLKDYWVNQVKNIPGVSFNQPVNPKLSCAIANVSIKGKKPEEVSGELFNKYKIHTVAINWEDIHGVRVTPNVYTSTKDLDKLAGAIRKIAS
ncbi:aminotransferase class V-fold PLP-dependent enzyme [Pollutibacter soli]|uniref:aminotransferase class V-fold PLP-dependent enzyme n=1 Tax=Pollutibacter soli TaxID=3034157 RepID=UPI003013D0B5